MSTDKQYGLIFETPTMKVERFPEGVHVSLSMGNGGYLVCGISHEDAKKLGKILSNDQTSYEKGYQDAQRDMAGKGI